MINLSGFSANNNTHLAANRFISGASKTLKLKLKGGAYVDPESGVQDKVWREKDISWTSCFYHLHACRHMCSRRALPCIALCLVLSISKMEKTAITNFRSWSMTKSQSGEL